MRPGLVLDTLVGLFERDEILEGIEELLVAPYGPSREHRIELRRIRDSLR